MHKSGTIQMLTMRRCIAAVTVSALLLGGRHRALAQSYMKVPPVKMNLSGVNAAAGRACLAAPVGLSSLSLNKRMPVSPMVDAPAPRTALPVQTEMELTQAERDALGSKLSFASDSGPFEWSQEKRTGGHYRLEFQGSESVAEMAPGLAMLTSRPWYEIYDGPEDFLTFQGTPALAEKPALQIRRVDLPELTVYHETRVGSIPGMIRQERGKRGLEGELDSEALRFTNPGTEPAFYTHIDHMSGIMLNRSNELLMLIDVRRRPKVLLATLIEPTSESERSKLLEIITGQPDYWANVQEAGSKDNEYDFDLFHNTVIGALREFHGIPIDMLLYVKDFKEELPIKARYVYAWPIFYNRELLKDARVAKVFYLPFSSAHTRGDGVDDSRFAAVSAAMAGLLMEYPRLHNDLWRIQQRKLLYLPMEAGVLAELFPESAGRETEFQREFWDRILPSFERYLMAEMGELLADSLKNTGYDSGKVEKFVLAEAVKYWRRHSAVIDQPALVPPYETTSL